MQTLNAAIGTVACRFSSAVSLQFCDNFKIVILLLGLYLCALIQNRGVCERKLLLMPIIEPRFLSCLTCSLVNLILQGKPHPNIVWPRPALFHGIKLNLPQNYVNVCVLQVVLRVCPQMALEEGENMNCKCLSIKQPMKIFAHKMAEVSGNFIM